jgi:hypothetical protein
MQNEQKIQISLRLTEQEKEVLDRYCEQEGRQQSELREGVYSGAVGQTQKPS